MAKATKTQRLAKAHKRVSDAEAALAGLTKKLYPIGCALHWNMGAHPQRGVVVMHSYSDRLCVENERTGRRYWIHSYQVRD